MLKAPFLWFRDLPADVGARFWMKVRVTPGCWLWLASKRNKGYGAFCFSRDGKVLNGRAPSGGTGRTGTQSQN